MFINEAFAQTSAGGAFSETGNLLIQLGLIMLIFYVLLIRPAQKQNKIHRQMIANLKKGDQIITSGGIFAKVIKADDPVEVVVEIASGVEIKVARFTVKEVLPQGGVEALKKIDTKKVEKKKPANSNKKK